MSTKKHAIVWVGMDMVAKDGVDNARLEALIVEMVQLALDDFITSHSGVGPVVRGVKARVFEPGQTVDPRNPDGSPFPDGGTPCAS